MVPDPATIDPFTLAAMSGAVSGFVGGCVNPFVSRTIGSGIHWLSDRYRGHPKEAIEAAQRNAVNFYGQVNICLDGLQRIECIKEKTERALADPDYTSLFQEAVLGAARTDSEQKHKILAYLVTDRLTSESDSLRTLAAHMACNAVPQLSAAHLRFLGFMAVIYALDTPAFITTASSEPFAENFEKGGEYPLRFRSGLKWISEELTPLLPIGDMTEYDYAHLAAVSCIAYGRVNKDLLDVLCWKFNVKGGVRAWMEKAEIGKILYQYWDQDMVSHASLTPAGALIGMHVRDILIQKRSNLAI